MKIGAYDVSWVNFGNFRLDGGAMFGSVPKNLWGKLIPSDSENCIPLATRCLVLRSPEKTILVDCGNGTKWSEKEATIFGIEPPSTDAQIINELEVTDLLLTHLHFDHAGGISKLNEKGELIASFPDATIWVQKQNLLNAEAPTLRERASYLPQNVSMVRKQSHQLIDGDGEIFPNIFVHCVHGHTRGQQWIEVRDTTTILLFPTDLMPTSRHVPLPFTMGYDICTETLLKEKEEFLEYAITMDALVLFEHDHDTPLGKIIRDDKGKYALKR